MNNTNKIKEFFKRVGDDDIYGISIKFSLDTFLWLDERHPSVNLLFPKRDFDKLVSKYGKVKDEMFVVFDGGSTTFIFEEEKKNKIKDLFVIE